MRIQIAEDEHLAQERIANMVHSLLPESELLPIVDSKEELRDVLLKRSDIDLLILDIELSDGRSIDLYNEIEIDVPVIFTTAYDQYALEAFQFLSIGYVLKPIQLPELKSAISKARKLIMPEKLVAEKDSQRFKSKFLIKAGNKLIYKDVSEAAYFYADGKEVYMVESDNRKFLIDHTLEELDRNLNPEQFFRISRKIILNIETVQEVRGLSNVRLEVKAPKGTLHPLYISRGRVKEFKAWLNR